MAFWKYFESTRLKNFDSFLTQIKRVDSSGCQDAKIQNPNQFFWEGAFFPFLALCLFFRCTWNLSNLTETPPVTCIKNFKFNVFSKSVRHESSKSKMGLTCSHFATKNRCSTLSLPDLQVFILWEKKTLFILYGQNKQNSKIKCTRVELSRT